MPNKNAIMANSPIPVSIDGAAARWVPAFDWAVGVGVWVFGAVEAEAELVPAAVKLVVPNVFVVVAESLDPVE